MCKRFGGGLVWLLENLNGLMLAVMCVIVFVNVVLRYAFRSSIDISEELARYLFVWITFLAAISACQENTHVKVTALMDRLPPSLQVVLQTLINALILVCCYYLFRSSYGFAAMNVKNYSPISGLSIAWFYVAGAVGAAGMALSILYRTWRLYVPGPKPEGEGRQ